MRAFSDVSSDAADIGRQLYWPKAGLHKTGGGQRLFFFYLVWKTKMALGRRDKFYTEKRVQKLGTSDHLMHFFKVWL